MEIEIIETNYLCPICKQNFKNSAEKNFHIRVKHWSKGSYKCKNCEKTFKKPFALSKHLKLKNCENYTNNKKLVDERRKLIKANNDLKRQMVILKRELITKGNFI